MAELARMAFATTRPVPEAPAVQGPPSYTWYGCDLVTGTIVEELPFVPGGPLQRILGAYTSLEGSFAVADAVGDWQSATDQGRTMLVCVRDEDEFPLWAGIVIGRTGGSSETIDLKLVSLEGYFDRRYVTYRTDTNTSGQRIVKDIANDADSDQGIGITYQFVDSFPHHDRTYTEDSDQTVYSQMVELMGIENGPEWTIDILWGDATKTFFEKRMVIDLSIGNNVDVEGLTEVNAVFDYPGSIREYEMVEDFSSSKAANHIEVFGDGEGPSRPAGFPARAEDLLTAGWPRYDYRRTISGATETDTLYSHAVNLLQWMQTGATIWTVSADASYAPRIGVDWALGGYVVVDIATSPRHPTGVAIIARAIGWELDTIGGVVTPLLEEEDLSA